MSRPPRDEAATGRSSGDLPRLDVLKALGDNTRYAIYLEIARSPVPLSTNQIAETLGLHPNTVRPHLERMRDVGLLVQSVAPSRGVGRPHHRWSLAPDAPSLGLEPPAFPLLARMLLRVASLAGAQEEVAEQVGQEQGEIELQRRRLQSSGLRGVVRLLEELGFEPELVDAEQSPSVDENESLDAMQVQGSRRDRPAGEQLITKVTVAFMNCPFEDLARESPALVCGLHCGLLQGFVRLAGHLELCSFRSLADRNPCQVDLELSTTAALAR